MFILFITLNIGSMLATFIGISGRPRTIACYPVKYRSESISLDALLCIDYYNNSSFIVVGDFEIISSKIERGESGKLTFLTNQGKTTLNKGYVYKYSEGHISKISSYNNIDLKHISRQLPDDLVRFLY